MSELKKTFLKNPIKKCQNVACEQKTHQQDKELWFRQKTRPTMNYEWIWLAN